MKDVRGGKRVCPLGRCLHPPGLQTLCACYQLPWHCWERHGLTREAPRRAALRPLNSALEVDLDFEQAVRPPPAPTEAATASLEDLIRQRCVERRWDDAPRVAPPAPEVKRRQLELDDQKSAKARAALQHASLGRRYADSCLHKGVFCLGPRLAKRSLSDGVQARQRACAQLRSPHLHELLRAHRAWASCMRRSTWPPGRAARPRTSRRAFVRRRARWPPRWPRSWMR